MIRDYEAPLVTRRGKNFKAVSVEFVRRQIGEGRASLHFQSARHALFIELTGGLLYERQVNGAAPLKIKTLRRMISFRPAYCEVKGWSQGQTDAQYAAVFFETDSPAGGWTSQDFPTQWSAPTCLEDVDLWKETEPLLRACRDQDADKHPMESFYVQGHALSLLATLADRFGSRSEVPARCRDERRLGRVLDFIRDDTTADLSLDQLAQIAHVSQSQLIRLFKAALGTTPMAYVASQRMDRARRQLGRNGTSIAELAAQFGYADQSHFTRQFRRATGVTPAQFRKETRGHSDHQMAARALGA